ncbi:hypothetical protein [Limnobacter sp.]|uniref:hypothetical protein n=1 Tax=Limnobacter sp. TaxID=2003368 RepID=UPI002FE35A0A
MPASPSGVGGSPSSPPQNVVAQSAARLPSGRRSVGEGGVSKAALVIWNKLSASLAHDPAANWNNALNTADELARSVCGQDLPKDLQADLLGNFKLLEQTLSGLKITPTDDHPDPHAYIKNRLSVFKLNIVTDSENLRKLHSLKINPQINQN